MTVNRTTLLDLPIITSGTESGLWGDYVNNGLTQYLDIAIAGVTSLTSANFTAGALTIETTEGTNTASNISATSAQYATIRVSSLAVNSTITVGNTGTNPGRSYRLINDDSTYTLTFKATGQTGITLQPGQSAVVAFNGTDYALVGTIGPTVPVARGGTGATTLTSNNVILGNGTSAVQFVAPSTAGNILTSNGTTWTSAAGASLNTPLAVIGNATAGAEIRLPEDTDNGSNYVALKAANSLAANVTFTLPNADGSNGQLIQTNGSGTLSFVTGAVAANFQEFTCSGTWTKPSGANFVMVEAWGAGGGGGSGPKNGCTTTFKTGGSGGGGGAYVQRFFKAACLGSTETVTIGAGGSAGAARTTCQNGAAGTTGGNTTFGSLLTAFGGGGGVGGSSGSVTYGGGGGGAMSAGCSYTGGGPVLSAGNSSGQFGGSNGGGAGAGATVSGWGGAGGAAGGYSGANPGGSSFQGGPGGGGGGGLNYYYCPCFGYVYGGSSVGGAGGSGTGLSGGGGAGGATTGANGTAGSGRQGGGAGAGSNNTTGNGGTGAAGGNVGGGGGGGGASKGGTSGAGGAGGKGLVRVYTW